MVGFADYISAARRRNSASSSNTGLVTGIGLCGLRPDVRRAGDRVIPARDGDCGLELHLCTLHGVPFFRVGHDARLPDLEAFFQSGREVPAVEAIDRAGPVVLGGAQQAKVVGMLPDDRQQRAQVLEAVSRCEQLGVLFSRGVQDCG